MKNLGLLHSYSITTDVAKNPTSICIDSTSSHIYFTNGKQLVSLDNDTKEISVLPLHFDDIENSHIVAMDHLIENQCICLAFSNGDIATCSTIDGHCDVVGSVESGVQNAIWSPDKEIFIVLTGAETFILMTKGFDPLLEENLHPESFGKSNPITVGWGSKETQFHGSEGKGAAKVKAMEPKEAVSWDDHKPKISWRGDGEFFVTSIIDKVQSFRKLRIWNRQGVLHYTGEIKEGLEQSLCWKPSGSLITCTQQLPNKHQVIFFEKNGLQHGNFDLPYAPSSFLVKEILWNSDSTVLAIWGHDLSDKLKFTVSVWTTSNYHWYLKQNLNFEKHSNPINNVLWDPVHPLRLHILFSDEKYFQYTWKWVINRSLGLTDDVSMAVIDNGKVLVTPFRRMLVPPPMCSYFFSCGVSINNVVFSSQPPYENVALILSNGQLILLSKYESKDCFPLPDGYNLTLQAAGGNGFKTVVKPHSYMGTYQLCWSDAPSSYEAYPLSLCHWTWLGNKLLCAASSGKLGPTMLVSFNTKSLTSETKTLQGKLCATMEESIIGICANEEGTIAVIQLMSGKFLKYARPTPMGEYSLSAYMYREKELSLSTPCLQFSVHSAQDEMVILALSEKNYIFCNNVVLDRYCTSYCWHNTFLLVTTADNLIKCYSDANILLSVNGPCLPQELATQPIERGAKIVASIPGDTRVIFQMPRGNLEVIHPRPLVVSKISFLLTNLQFKMAFDVSKEHRINLNILYDNDPQQFLKSAGVFVDQIISPSDINLFLVSLVNENISHKLYPIQYPGAHTDQIHFSTKRDLVCNAIRAALVNRDLERYFECIIATHCQKTKPELEEALIKIKELKDSSERDIATADNALKFLLWLVDLRDLYKVALGTYDFKLTIMVAEKSNMDPMEYLPFLNEMKELEENYCHYKIDLHLERYKKALVNLSKCEGEERFEECLSLIKKQRLYTSALYLFPPQSDHFKIVWEEYGDYLASKNYSKDAAIVYSKSGHHEKAIKAFQEHGDWQLAMYSARQANYSKEKMTLLYQSLALRLKELQRFEESALILENYVQEIEASIKTLIEGQLWDSVVNMITKYNKECLVNTNLRPAANDHRQHLVNYLTGLRKDFLRHVDRLKVLREAKQNNKPDGDYDDSEADSASETSSISAASSKQLSGSLATRKTSRSKRKTEIKKYRLKEGSPNEELALMSELSDIIAKVDKEKDNFSSFVRMLLLFWEKEDAKIIHDLMKEFVQIIEKEMPKIWMINRNAADMNFGPDFTSSAMNELIEKQKRTIEILSDPSLAPPKWQKTIDLFFQFFD